MNSRSVSFAPSLFLGPSTSTLFSRSPGIISIQPSRKVSSRNHPRKRHAYPTVTTLHTNQPHEDKPNLLKIQHKKMEVLLPKFWTAALIELLAGFFGISVCTICRLPILGAGFSLSVRHILQSFKVAVPFLFGFWMIELLPASLKPSTEKRFKAFFGRRKVLDIAIFCICVSLGEELLFRSCLLGGMCAIGMQPFVALTASAFIFGILHAYTKLYILLASIAGFLLGLMFIQTSSILQPIIVHFLYDFITIMVMKIRWRSRTAIK